MMATLKKRNGIYYARYYVGSKRKTAGIMHSSASAFSRRHTSNPFMSGMSTSSRTRSGRSREAASSPSLPPSAQTRSRSYLHRRALTKASASGLSSIIKTFMIYHPPTPRSSCSRR